MRRKRHLPEQIIQKLREADVDLVAGRTVEEVCKKLGVTSSTFYRWTQDA
jgi:putative transposase